MVRQAHHDKAARFSSFTRYALWHNDLRVKGERRIWKYFLFVAFVGKDETSKNHGFIEKIPFSTVSSVFLTKMPMLSLHTGPIPVSTGSVPVDTGMLPAITNCRLAKKIKVKF